jgi:TetR/AcrR family transcriptional regulator
MRKQRDGMDTRERVLTAASELFAQRGFAGTSLALISKSCGISDGLILHHFQTKENLYRQVLEDQAGRYANALVHARNLAGSPAETMQQTLAASFNFWKQDGTYQRISLWASLEGRTELADQEAGLTVALVREVEHLQIQGLIDDRFNPMIFLTMIIGPIHFWLRYRNQFKTILNLTDSPDALDELFLGQLVSLVKEMSQKPSNGS